MLPLHDTFSCSQALKVLLNTVFLCQVYPTLVIRGTGLYELWKQGLYRNYPPDKVRTPATAGYNPDKCLERIS